METNVIVATSLIIAFFMEIPTGALADYLGYVKTTILMGILLCSTNLVFLICDTIPAFLIAQICLGISCAFESGTLDAWIIENTSEKESEHIFVTKNKFISIMMLVAGFLGGVIADIFIEGIFLFALIAAMLFVVLSILLMPKLTSQINKHHTYNVKENINGIKKIINDSITYCIKNKKVRNVILFNSLLAFAFSPVFVFWSPVLHGFENINYTIIGVDNLTVNTTTVTIQYTEDGVTKTVTQPITVKEAEQTPNPDNPGEETPEEPENPNNPGGETPEQPEDSQEKPVSSDFTNVQSVITESKLYFSSDDLSEESSENTIKISGIKIGDESNTYTYYYYVTGKKEDDYISYWTKAEAVKESDGTYSITLHIKSEELQNYNEIAESDNLYVYIREVAEVNQQSAEQIVTLKVDNQVEPECYIDGVMVGGIDDVLNYNSSNNSNNTNNTNQNKDNTVASGILPYAGGFTFKIIVVVLILAFGGFAYYRYKNIDR